MDKSKRPESGHLKVDEIMRVVADNVAACERGAFDKIRKAIEAALKPGVPQAWLWQFSDGDWHDVPFATKDECEDECAGYEGKAHPLYLAAPPAQAPPLTTCNCRWDGKTQVQQCTLHEAHIDAIHEWAERAKSAEAKLKTPPPRLTDEQVKEILLDNAGPTRDWYKQCARAIETAVRKQFLGDRDE